MAGDGRKEKKGSIGRQNKTQRMGDRCVAVIAGAVAIIQSGEESRNVLSGTGRPPAACVYNSIKSDA